MGGTHLSWCYGVKGLYVSLHAAGSDVQVTDTSDGRTDKTRHLIESTTKTSAKTDFSDY